jgi:Protein of unknown function (DUF3892)
MIYITEVRMSHEGSRPEHIEAVRWERRDSPETGESTVEEMVDWIGNKRGFAHVRDTAGNDIPVHVVHADPPYLRTVPDDVTSDNLLSLPRYGTPPP